MRSLDTARQACEKYHPGLCADLEGISLGERERVGSPVIEMFRTAGGSGLLVPESYDGAEASALDATRVMRGLASYSPSLGAAVCMHHFTVAMLFALADNADRLTDAQRDVMRRIVTDRTLMASGWSEGRTNQNILNPAVTARADGADWVLDGAKKPCSLSGSMDVLTASVGLPGTGPDGAPTLGLALVPADAPGLSVHPFWGTDVLAGAQSDEVRLKGVRVPDELVIRGSADDPDRLDDLQTAGFVWFVMLISSVYAGAAGALVAQLVERAKGSVSDRAQVVTELETAVALLEGVARSVDDGLSGDDAVAAVLFTRYAMQGALTRATDLGVELLGGMSFMSSPDTAYLASAVRALAFHPPSRSSAAKPLLDYVAGNPLRLA